MNKITALIFALAFLMIGIENGWASCGRVLENGVLYEKTVVEGIPQELGKDFSKIAMNKFIADTDPGINIWVVKAAIEKYSIRMAQIFLDAELGIEATKAMMEKFAAWYGETLRRMFNGENADSLATGYNRKIADLFHQENFALSLQSDIIALNSRHLERMNIILKDLKGQTKQTSGH